MKISFSGMKRNRKIVSSIALILILAFSSGIMTGRFVFGIGVSPNYPNINVNNVAPYSYMIQTDGNGWYWAVNGTDSSIYLSSTNATAVINNVFGNLASGGSVLIKAGNYSITSSLTILNNTFVYGEGAATNLIRNFHGANTQLLRASALYETNIKVAHLQVDGNATVGVQGEHNIEFAYCSNVIVEDVLSHGGGCCNIVFSRCTNSSIINNVCYNNLYDNSITVFNGCNNIVVSGNRVYGSWGVGIEVESSTTQAITVSNNIVSYCGDDGIRFLTVGTTTAPALCSVTGNICFNNVYNGLEISTAPQVTVSGNTFYNNGYHGIYSTGNSTITGNTFYSNVECGIKFVGGKNTVTSNTITGSQRGIELSGGDNIVVGNRMYNNLYQGIESGSNINYNVITNNIIKGSYWGIYLPATNTYNLITDNNVAENSVGAISISGSTNKVSGNIGFVTENTVLNVANTTATTFVFNHGLASTANSVNVQFNFTGWTSWTWTSTTTQVTVTVTGTLPQNMSILAADVKYIP